MSNLISQNLTLNYEKFKEDYNRGILTDQQLIARIVCLRDRASRPEDINLESLEESLKFDESHIAKYIEERDWQKSCIKSKDEKIRQIESNLEKIQIESTSKIGDLEMAIMEQSATSIELQAIINQQNLFIEQQKQDSEAQNKLIEQLQQEREIRNKRLEKIKLICKRIIKILIRFAVYILLLFILYMLSKKMGLSKFNNLFGFISIAGVLIDFVSYIKKDYDIKK